MNTKQNRNSSGSTFPVRRVIAASAYRRLHSDMARDKKSKKILRRMKKDKDE